MFFLCSMFFIMSQVTDHYYYDSTCDSCILCCLTHHCNWYNGFQFCGPTNIGSAWCGSAATVDLEEYNEGFCWLYHYAAATTTSVKDAFSGICQLCHGTFFLSELSLSPIHMIYVCVCNGVCFQFPYSPMGLTIEVCITATLWIIALAGICASWWWYVAHARSPPSSSSSHYCL